MKVRFPGPKCERVTKSQSFPMLKVTLAVGINDIPDAAAEQLLRFGVVSKVEPEYKGPIPTEGEAFVPPTVEPSPAQPKRRFRKKKD